MDFGSPGRVLPLFPEGGGGCSALSRAGCERAWMAPALPGSAGSGAGNERAVGARPGEGPAGPFLAVPLLRKGRAVSLTYLQRA